MNDEQNNYNQINVLKRWQRSSNCCISSCNIYIVGKSLVLDCQSDKTSYLLIITLVSVQLRNNFSQF